MTLAIVGTSYPQYCLITISYGLFQYLHHTGLWRSARKVPKTSKTPRPPAQSGPHFSETMGESEGTQWPLCFAACPCIVVESICWDPTTNVL